MTSTIDPPSATGRARSDIERLPSISGAAIEASELAMLGVVEGLDRVVVTVAPSRPVQAVFAAGGR